MELETSLILVHLIKGIEPGDKTMNITDIQSQVVCLISGMQQFSMTLV